MQYLAIWNLPRFRCKTAQCTFILYTPKNQRLDYLFFAGVRVGSQNDTTFEGEIGFLGHENQQPHICLVYVALSIRNSLHLAQQLTWDYADQIRGK